ncbi:MAG TPA: hypothetical protein VG294_15405 [Solirubrobacteraceae bacterium]|nr:hypothetical protein [Solirubrobacteraceae bacterium]
MSVRVRDVFMRGPSDLRFEPIEKRIRPALACHAVLIRANGDAAAAHGFRPADAALTGFDGWPVTPWSRRR